MALAPSFYSTGTATVAANGTAVTGQGTSWLNAVQPGDLFGTHKGIPIRIASVNSNTSLTLAFPWPGAAQNAAAYEIQLLPDAGRVLETTRQLLEMLSDGDLAAIAALTSAADKLPYYTGSGTAALADLKAKGRDIIAASDTLSLLAKLGPVNGGAGSPVPSAAGVGLSDGDFNTVVVPGTYNITGSWGNGYSGAAASTTFGLLHVFARGSQIYQEYWTATAGPRKYYRFSGTGGGGTWPDPWKALAGEAVGTVANASGFPAGAIIERGSNANGDYTRFADGTQICSSRVDITTLNISTASGSLFIGPVQSWTYPVSFNTLPVVSAQGLRTNDALIAGGSIRALSLTAIQFVPWMATQSPANTGGKEMLLSAIGRWF